MAHCTLLKRLAKAGSQLHEVIRELRHITEGIFPPALAEQGLAAVVEMLAERAPLPVLFEVPPRRWPDRIEQAAYFILNEALANVYKHARAVPTLVRLLERGPVIVIEVSDDGVGGADPDQGTGLRGLRDRVAALGGTLHLQSPPGGGTRLTVELPWK